MRTLVILFLLLLLRGTAGAQHENQAYLPLTKSELSKQFPITYVGTLGNGRPGYFDGISDKQMPKSINVGPFGAIINVTDEGELVISGSDRRKRQWSIHLGDAALNYACRFYEADLDRNGTHDAVLVFPTGGNGLAPTNHLFAITFDEHGRPVTFEADGYFQEKDSKIFDLVDLNRNGRAELIYMNFSDGYWITNVYEVRSARWQRIVGQHVKRVYPLYTRFTFNENHKPTVPKRGRRPFAADLSNKSPRIVGRLLSYKWANVSYSEDISLTVKDAHGKVVVSKPVSWYASFAIVIDSPQERKIITLSANEEAVKAQLDKIISNNYKIALFGIRSRDGSSPEMLWARP